MLWRQTNLECIEQNLFMTRPHKNESLLDFDKRLQILRSHLDQSVNNFSDTEMTQDARLVHPEQYDQITLKTFIRNLSGSLQTRIKNPDALETTLNYILEEYTINSMSHCTISNKITDRFLHNQIPQTIIIILFPIHKREYQIMGITPDIHWIMQQQRLVSHKKYSRHHYPENQNCFPRQPIQIIPRPVPQKPHPTNSQVFGRPKNVFVPTGQVPYHKPQSMSRVSIQNKQKPTGTHIILKQRVHQISPPKNFSN